MSNVNAESLARNPIRREAVNRQSPTTTAHNSSHEEDMSDSEEFDSSHGSNCSSTRKRKKLYPDISDEIELQSSPQSNFSFTPESISTQKGHDDSFFNNISKMYLIPLLLIALCIIYLSFQTTPSSDQPMSAEAVIKELRKNFTNQPNLSFRVLKAALQNVFSPEIEPKNPAILLFVSSSGAEDFVICFTKSLVNSIYNSQIHSLVEIEGKDYIGKDPLNAKKDLDDKIKKSLLSPHLNIILIKKLNLIPANAAMFLHNYCDHENAPYKRAVIIMTVASNETINLNINDKTVDGHANGVLREAWKDMHSDQLESLLARISVSVIPIWPESSGCAV